MKHSWTLTLLTGMTWALLLSSSLSSVYSQLGPFYLQARSRWPFFVSHLLVAPILVSLGVKASLYCDVGGPLGSGPSHSLTLLTTFLITHLLKHSQQPHCLPCRSSDTPNMLHRSLYTVSSAWNAVLLGISLTANKSFTMFYVSLFSTAFIP